MIAAAMIAAALAFVALKGAKGVGYAIAAGAVDLVDGVFTGTVETIGINVGIPKTNLSECEKAKAEGRTWDASFACPAANFIGYLWD